MEQEEKENLKREKELYEEKIDNLLKEKEDRNNFDNISNFGTTLLNASFQPMQLEQHSFSVELNGFEEVGVNRIKNIAKNIKRNNMINSKNNNEYKVDKCGNEDKYGDEDKEELENIGNKYGKYTKDNKEDMPYMPNANNCEEEEANNKFRRTKSPINNNVTNNFTNNIPLIKPDNRERSESPLLEIKNLKNRFNKVLGDIKKTFQMSDDISKRNYSVYNESRIDNHDNSTSTLREEKPMQNPMMMSKMSSIMPNQSNVITNMNISPTHTNNTNFINHDSFQIINYNNNDNNYQSFMNFNEESREIQLNMLEENEGIENKLTHNNSNNNNYNNNYNSQSIIEINKNKKIPSYPLLSNKKLNLLKNKISSNENDYTSNIESINNSKNKLLLIEKNFDNEINTNTQSSQIRLDRQEKQYTHHKENSLNLESTNQNKYNKMLSRIRENSKNKAKSIDNLYDKESFKEEIRRKNYIKEEEDYNRIFNHDNNNNNTNNLNLSTNNPNNTSFNHIEIESSINLQLLNDKEYNKVNSVNNYNNVSNNVNNNVNNGTANFNITNINSTIFNITSNNDNQEEDDEFIQILNSNCVLDEEKQRQQELIQKKKDELKYLNNLKNDVNNYELDDNLLNLIDEYKNIDKKNENINEFNQDIEKTIKFVNLIKRKDTKDNDNYSITSGQTINTKEKDRKRFSIYTEEKCRK